MTGAGLLTSAPRTFVSKVYPEQPFALHGLKPLLVIDVWEHAFARDYKTTERGKYIEAFFRNIDWTVVERRLR